MSVSNAMPWVALPFLLPAATDVTAEPWPPSSLIPRVPAKSALSGWMRPTNSSLLAFKPLSITPNITPSPVAPALYAVRAPCCDGPSDPRNSAVSKLVAGGVGGGVGAGVGVGDGVGIGVGAVAGGVGVGAGRDPPPPQADNRIIGANAAPKYCVRLTRYFVILPCLPHCRKLYINSVTDSLTSISACPNGAE